MLKNNILFKAKIRILTAILLFFALGTEETISNESLEENAIYDLGGFRGIFVDETDNWTTLCKYDDIDYCSLMQFIQSEDKNINHRAVVQIIKRQKENTINIYTSDGFPLDQGVGIIFNGNNKFEEYKSWIPYAECSESLCRAELNLDNDLLERFSFSDNFIIVIRPEKIKRIGLMVPNNGFEIAFKKMKKMPN